MRSRSKWIAAAVVLACLTGLLLTVPFAWNEILYKKALQSYELSRQHLIAAPIESYDWATKGVLRDMEETEVDTIMQGAAIVHRQMPQEFPPWNGYVNLYVFEYGPPKLFHEEDKYIYEWFWVYFDSHGHAKKIRRSVVRSARRTVRQCIDLEHQTISKCE